MIEAEITTGGDVNVEGHRVGHLHGFRFVADPSAEGEDARAVRNAAAKALAGEIEARADRLSRAPDGDIKLDAEGSFRWLGETVAKIAGGQDALHPTVILLADEQLSGPARDKVQARLDQWIAAQIANLLKPLVDLRDAADIDGIGKGVAYRIVEALGVIERSQIAEDVKALDQTMRASLRKYGVRFGAYHVFVPALLKPAPSALVARLWALANPDVDTHSAGDLNHLSASGRTSIPVDKAVAKPLYRIAGFRVCGERAVRIDILERLADIIRPLIAWKPLDPTVTPPEGALAGGGAFTVTVAMTSLLGCSGEDFASVLKSLGYRVEKRKVKKPVAAVAVPAPAPEASTEAVVEAVVEEPVVAEAAPTEAVAEASATVEVENIAVVEEAVVAEEAVAAVDASAESSPEAGVEAVEDVEIDVWRPGRFERNENQGHRGPRREHGGERRHGGGERGENRGERGGDRGERRGDRANAAGRHARDAAFPDRDGGGRRDGGQRHERGEGNRPPRRDDRNDRPRGDRRPERTEKPIDPNSPFAALLALKADLENKGDKKK